MADCRQCVYFKHYHEMSLEEIERCEILAARRGEECLGWCTLFNRGITHFTGQCSGFKRKRWIPNKTLMDFFKKGGER